MYLDGRWEKMSCTSTVFCVGRSIKDFDRVVGVSLENGYFDVITQCTQNNDEGEIVEENVYQPSTTHYAVYPHSFWPSSRIDLELPKC